MARQKKENDPAMIRATEYRDKVLRDYGEAHPRTADANRYIEQIEALSE